MKIVDTGSWWSGGAMSMISMPSSRSRASMASEESPSAVTRRTWQPSR
jgi:hypothetical protein